MADPALLALARRPEYAGLSDADALARALAPSVPRHDDRKKTYVALALALGDTARITRLDGALKTAGLEWVRLSLAGEGLNLRDPLTLGAIDGLEAAGLFTPEDARALREIGSRLVSEYEDAGGSGSPAEADFAAARARVALDAVRLAVAGRYNAAVAAIDSGEVGDLASAAAFLGAPLEAPGA